MKPVIIHIPEDRPARCVECPLLGKKPEHLLTKGERYTLYCFLPGHEREISGRGAKAVDLRHRNSCHPDVYRKVFNTKQGDIPVSFQDWKQYDLEHSSWLWERDRRKTLEEDNGQTD